MAGSWGELGGAGKLRRGDKVTGCMRYEVVNGWKAAGLGVGNNCFSSKNANIPGKKACISRKDAKIILRTCGFPSKNAKMFRRQARADCGLGYIWIYG